MFLNFPSHRMCKMRTVNAKENLTFSKTTKLSVLGRQLKRNACLSKKCFILWMCVISFLISLNMHHCSSPAQIISIFHYVKKS